MRNNVLITSGGKWVAMVLHAQHAVREIDALRGGRVIVGDRAPLTPAGCFADDAIVLPSIADDGYIDAVLEACRRSSIRIVLPIIDADVVRLAPFHDRFQAVGTHLVAPTEDLVELCFDKASFHDFAVAEGLNPPRRIFAGGIGSATYPLFFKPLRGFGSVGTGSCDTPEDAEAALSRTPELLLQEFVDAPEVSVDAFVNGEGRCTVAVQRVRDKVVGGESWQSHTIRDDAVRALTSLTVRALADRGFAGPLNIQLFRTPEPKIIEVNTRLGSASVFSNFATAGRLFTSVLAHACGGDVDGDPDDYEVGVKLYRFFGDVYHDGSVARQILPSRTLR